MTITHAPRHRASGRPRPRGRPRRMSRPHQHASSSTAPTAHRSDLPTPDDGVGYFRARSLAHEAALRAQAEAIRRRLARARARAPARRCARSGTRPSRGASARRRAVARQRRVLAHVPPAPSSARPSPASPSATATTPRTPSARRSRGGGAARGGDRRGETSRFRICANDDCRWVFEDTSRGGRRRWCDMRRAATRRRCGASGRSAPTGAPGGDPDADRRGPTGQASRARAAA